MHPPLVTSKLHHVQTQNIKRKETYWIHASQAARDESSLITASRMKTGLTGRLG